MTGGRQTAECLNDYFSSFKAISCPPLTCQSLTLIETSNFVDYEKYLYSFSSAQIMPSIHRKWEEDKSGEKFQLQFLNRDNYFNITRWKGRFAAIPARSGSQGAKASLH